MNTTHNDDEQETYIPRTQMIDPSFNDPRSRSFHEATEYDPKAGMSSSEAYPHNSETTATVVATVAAEQTRQQHQLELERKAELRRAGQDFLDRAMHTASKADGTDPFQTAIQPSSSSRLQSSTSISKRRRPGRPGASEDPDVIAFGLLYESSKLYVYMAMYVVCHAVGLVLMKVGWD